MTKDATLDILLVEDNRADAHLLTEFFIEKGSDASIQWVTDGYEALDYVYQRDAYKQAKRPDMIILDLGMPRISGYEVLKQLKENAQYSSIPTIVLTTSRNPLDRKQCTTLGADAFLSKPQSLKGYEELVDQLIHFNFLPLAATAS